MTKIVNAFFRGWLQSMRFPGLWILKWFVHGLTVIALAVPVMALAWQDVVSQSRDPFSDLTGFYATLIQNAENLEKLAPSLVLILFIFLLAHWFISAGIFRTFYGGIRTSWSEFWGNCGRFFFPVIRVSLVNGVFVIIIVISPAILLFLGMEPFKEWAETHRLPVVLNWIWVILVFFLASIAARVYDYSRILVCGRREGSAFKAFSTALSFVARQHGGTFLLWLCFLCVSSGLIWLGVWSDWVAGWVPIEPAVVHLLFGQILVLLRIMGSMASWAGQLDYLKANQSWEEEPEPISSTGLTADETVPGI